MSGLTVVQTSTNVATFTGAWHSFTTAIINLAAGNGSMDDVATASTALVSAATSFSESPGYSAISRGTGYISGMANFNTDFASYQTLRQTANPEHRQKLWPG